MINTGPDNLGLVTTGSNTMEKLTYTERYPAYDRKDNRRAMVYRTELGDLFHREYLAAGYELVAYNPEPVKIGNYPEGAWFDLDKIFA